MGKLAVTRNNLHRRQWSQVWFGLVEIVHCACNPWRICLLPFKYQRDVKKKHTNSRLVHLPHPHSRDWLAYRVQRLDNVDIRESDIRAWVDTCNKTRICRQVEHLLPTNASPPAGRYESIKQVMDRSVWTLTIFALVGTFSGWSSVRTRMSFRW